MSRAPSVLFVCTANVCRSPMAMGLLRSKLGDHAAGWRVESAGTWTRDGELAAQKLIIMLAERGIDLRSHRSRGVSKELLRSFNLILTMERGHKEALQVEFPQQAGKIHLFSEMVGLVYDIQDPIGGTMEDFRNTLEEVEQILTDGFPRIKQLAQSQGSHENR
jgi:protein-tyrosine-phosphatase